MKTIALATLFILAASVGADILPASFCSDLFSGTNAASATHAANPLLAMGTYTSLLGISLLVVLLVLTVLGVVYAFGMAFRVESLKAFTKSELLESFFNVLLIMIIASGVAFSGAAIAFVANIGLAGIQTATSGSIQTVTPGQCYPSSTPVLATCSGGCKLVGLACGTGDNAGKEYVCDPTLSSSAECAPPAPPSAAPVTDTKSVYMNICTNYVNNGINTAWNNFLQVDTVSVVMFSFMFFTADLRVAGDGVLFSPWGGVWSIYTILGTQIGVFDAVVGILLMITFLLYLLYSIFPVFLYVGILLRSFPWTRAAGGTFIAMFIAFYIVFPGILYPFSLYMQSIYITLSVPSSGLTGFSLSSLGTLLPYLSGTAMLTEIGQFAQTVAFVGLQLMGVLIGLVVSLDLVEAIAKLLGAPSMHTRSLLGKIL